MVLVYYIKARQYIYYLNIQYTYYEYALSNIENQYSKCKGTTIYLSPVCFLNSKKRLVLVIFKETLCWAFGVEIMVWDNLKKLLLLQANKNIKISCKILYKMIYVDNIESFYDSKNGKITQD